MAAVEQQAQRVVVGITPIGEIVGELSGGPDHDHPRRRPDLRLAPPPRHLGVEVVAIPLARDVEQPAARVRRRTPARPFGGRREQRVLHGVLGEGEVAAATDDGAEIGRAHV